MDCSDFVNGIDLETGKRTNETISIKSRLYLQRVGQKNMKDKHGVYKSSLIYHNEAIYGLSGKECGKLIKSCMEGQNAISINQMLAVLCFWTYGLLTLPWTFSQNKVTNRFEMSYGAGGAIRDVVRHKNWEIFHAPARISENSLI